MMTRYIISPLERCTRGERIKIAVRNRDEYNYLVSLKYCLQAYVDGVPVLIQQESFPKYNEYYNL